MRFKNAFWGFFFVFAAVLVIVHQLGYLNGIDFFSLVLMVLLAPIVIKSIVRLNFYGILLPLAMFIAIFRVPLGIFITPGSILFAAVLLSVGLSLMFHRRNFWGFYYNGNCRNGRCHEAHYEGTQCNYEDARNNDENFSLRVESLDENEVEFAESFGSSSKYINSQSLQKANFSCSFGALKIYFDNAKLHPDGAVVCFDCKFSGVEMYVPREWHVKISVSATLGGVSEKNRPKAQSAEVPELTLEGNVSFGGIEIIYV